MKSATHSTFGVRFVSWALLTAIAVMTLGPIGLRPQMHFAPNFERFATYVVLGILFALSYPQRRLWLLRAFIVGAAGALEIGQSFVSGRDPHLTDFLFKAGGAVIELASSSLHCALRFVVLIRALVGIALRDVMSMPAETLYEGPAHEAAVLRPVGRRRSI